jgi:hypothetical protein
LAQQLGLQRPGMKVLYMSDFALVTGWLVRTNGIQSGEGTQITGEFQSRGSWRLVNSAQLRSPITKARGGLQTWVVVPLGVDQFTL